MRLLRGGVRERRNLVFDWVRDWYEVTLDWSLRHGRLVVGASVALAAAALALDLHDRRRVHAAPR